MKKSQRLITLLFYLGFLSLSSYSQNYMGGEITWECLSNGNYIFTLKIYRECSRPTFASMQTITSNSPAGNITLYLVSGWPKDISPTCNSNAGLPHISCQGSPTFLSGAVSEYMWKSYPVALNGIPPAMGWTFLWSSCCHMPSVNVLNGHSKRIALRSVMYTSSNQNMFPCFDSSPSFAEAPRTVIPKGDFSYNNIAFDQDLDSLAYEWGQPWQNANQPLSPYSSGYSYLKPLPDTIQNPNNQALKLGSQTGIVHLDSDTVGLFLTSIKVTSYRNGQKLSEIWREFYVLIADYGDTTNIAPIITTPTATNHIFDTTVFVGDTLQFLVSAVDSQFLSTGSMQNSRLKFIGQMFGDYVLPSGQSNGLYVDTSGCPIKPCATMNPAPAPGDFVEGIGTVQSDFFWVPNCDHIHAFSGSNSHEYSFHFFVEADDDFCPVSASSNRLIRVKVMYYPAIEAVDSLWGSFDYLNQQVALHWNPAKDLHNQFVSYTVYMASSATGPFTLVDSISDINQSNTYINNAQFPSGYYYVNVNSTCLCDSNYVSTSSAILNLNFTSINEPLISNEFTLLPCQPNPAQESTQIRFQVRQQARLNYRLMDVHGKVLEQQNVQAHTGENSLQQKLQHLKAGIYFYSLELNGIKKIGRLVVLR